MKPTLFALSTVLLLMAATPAAHAVQCRRGINRAGCVGANGAVTTGPQGTSAVGKNGETASTRSPPPPGTTTSKNGNSVTKGVEPGCFYVNGQRKCR
jgi:hypothetical protein